MYRGTPVLAEAVEGSRWAPTCWRLQERDDGELPEAEVGEASVAEVTPLSTSMLAVAEFTRRKLAAAAGWVCCPEALEPPVAGCVAWEPI